MKKILTLAKQFDDNNILMQNKVINKRQNRVYKQSYN